MTKAAKGPASQTDDVRKIFSVRLPLSLIARIEAYGMVLKHSNQHLTEAAFEKYFRSLRLTADQQRKVSVLLGE